MSKVKGIKFYAQTKKDGKGDNIYYASKDIKYTTDNMSISDIEDSVIVELTVTRVFEKTGFLKEIEIEEIK